MSAKRVVITGASGFLGSILTDHLRRAGGYDLCLIGRRTSAEVGFLQADIGEWSNHWTDALQDAHAVIHLAGLRESAASWAEIQRTNIDGTLNVFEAAARGNVRRVVFASTSWVLGGYFKSDVQLTPSLAPKPTSHYAVSKLAGEAIAKHFSSHRAVSAICFRIGTCHRDEQDPTRIAFGRQQKWLSARDFCHGAECAIQTDDLDFAILNLTSRIDESPWDIGETERLIGYRPQDKHRPRQHSLLRRARRKANQVLSRRT